MIRILLLAAALASPALAQHGGPIAPPSGFGAREVAGIPPTELADLRAGRGMGLALPAEVNGYPGPLHALELADRLGLSPDQRATMERLIAVMRSETIPLGERVIVAERALDAVFMRGDATAGAVDRAVRETALARGMLRAAHLRVHLAARETMTPVQRDEYARLRGHAGPDPLP